MPRRPGLLSGIRLSGMPCCLCSHTAIFAFASIWAGVNAGTSESNHLGNPVPVSAFSLLMMCQPPRQLASA
jgi:hypothetical protein